MNLVLSLTFTIVVVFVDDVSLLDFIVVVVAFVNGAVDFSDVFVDVSNSCKPVFFVSGTLLNFNGMN